MTRWDRRWLFLSWSIKSIFLLLLFIFCSLENWNWLKIWFFFIIFIWSSLKIDLGVYKSIFGMENVRESREWRKLTVFVVLPNNAHAHIHTQQHQQQKRHKPREGERNAIYQVNSDCRKSDNSRWFFLFWRQICAISCFNTWNGST